MLGDSSSRLATSVTVVSGGMDSITAAYLAAHNGFDQIIVSFDYGQRHHRELAYAAGCAADLGVEHVLIHIDDIANHLRGSALTDPSVPVPEGHYADASMRSTIVPNRNAMFISMAYAIAVARRAGRVTIGVHAGDHPIYPDCRPRFVYMLEKALKDGNGGIGAPDLFAPFVHLTKADIVKIGSELGVPYDKTWSCYVGGDVHCGKCGTCVERREAFEIAGVDDPTEYMKE